MGSHNILVHSPNYNKGMPIAASKTGKHRLYEINITFVNDLRCRGKGQPAAKTLCSIMELFPPIALKLF